jgi:anti-anti-sigma regulatory factor
MIDLHTDGQGKLTVVGEATIFEVARLRELLLAALRQRPTPKALDLSQLEALDTAGAQLLLAFKRESPALSVHSCPAQLRAHLENIGLASLLL